MARVLRESQDQVLDLPRVSKSTLQRVQQHFRFDRLTHVEAVTDPQDGFVKHLFRNPDGTLHEAVWIPLEKPDTATVCLSSQIGCSLDCAFCATGRLGFRRNLRTWEMIDAFLQVRARSPRRLTGAVFMGQGEPFYNYDAVIAAARLLCHPCGGAISGTSITISTAGVVPAIRRYTAEAHPFRLIVSLSSADPERRRAIMPRVSRWPIEELAEAIRAHAAATRDRMTIAWVNLAGLNMGPDEVEKLRALLGDVPLRLNLIDVNDPTGQFQRPDHATVMGFMDQLQVLGVPVVRRYTGGQTRSAACGMLASTRWEPEGSTTPPD